MAERGIYRSIPCALLAGKDFRALPERARWIFVVLKMNIGAVGIDTWYPDELVSRLASESGASSDQVKLALDVLEHEGWLEREDNIIWLIDHITHDPHLASDNKLHRKSVQRHLAGLPRNEIVRRFVAKHPDWFHAGELDKMGLSWVANGYREGSDTRIRTPKKSKIQEKEKEKEKEKDTDSNNGVSPVGESGGGVTDKPLPWPAEGTAIWTERVGPIEVPRFGKTAKPMVDSYGWPRTKSALLAYIELNEGRARRLDWFVGDAVRWVEMGDMPLIDPETGNLTKRGEIVAKQAQRGAA